MCTMALVSRGVSSATDLTVLNSVRWLESVFLSSIVIKRISRLGKVWPISHVRSAESFSLALLGKPQVEFEMTTASHMSGLVGAPAAQLVIQHPVNGWEGSRRWLKFLDQCSPCGWPCSVKLLFLTSASPNIGHCVHLGSESVNGRYRNWFLSLNINKQIILKKKRKKTSNSI